MNEGPSRWSPVATRGDTGPGELANASCALCGIELSIISLVPDGGPGSAEVRWYCRDIVSCTERWTADRARRGGRAGAPDGNAPDPNAEPVPGKQAPSADAAPVRADAQAPAEEPVPADEPASAEQPAPAETPRRAKVRAGHSGGRGRRAL